MAVVAATKVTSLEIDSPLILQKVTSIEIDSPLNFAFAID